MKNCSNCNGLFITSLSGRSRKRVIYVSQDNCVLWKVLVRVASLEVHTSTVGRVVLFVHGGLFRLLLGTIKVMM